MSRNILTSFLTLTHKISRHLRGEKLQFHKIDQTISINDDLLISGTIVSGTEFPFLQPNVNRGMKSPKSHENMQAETAPGPNFESNDFDIGIW